MYRYKRSIPLSYERQGQLYFWMLQYRDLPPHEQQIIREVCAAVGGDEYAPALFEFVTTDHGCTAISMRHNLSYPTLWRYVRKTYLEISRQEHALHGQKSTPAE